MLYKIIYTIVQCNKTISMVLVLFVCHLVGQKITTVCSRMPRKLQNTLLKTKTTQEQQQQL